MQLETLYKTPSGSESVARIGGAALGHFVRGPLDVAWRAENQIGSQGLVVFPSRAVEIAQEGRPRALANPGSAIFYNPSACYYRKLVDPRGDDCRYIALSDALWREIVCDLDPKHTGRELFRFAAGPISPAIAVRFGALLRALQGGVDALAAEEEMLALARGLVEGAVAEDVARSFRPEPLASHIEAARALEGLLSLRFRENDTLDQLASRVGLSPYHAARLFRRVTGRSLHGYRERLRILASLPEIASGERLDVIALGLGYASHAHFSDRFRKIMGFPPRDARATAGSTISKAPTRRSP